MNIADRIKHAPKWVWFTVAGVTVGVIAIRIYQGRDAPATDQVADDQSGTVPGSQSPSPVNPVIVPPIITGGGSSDADYAGIIGAIGGVFTPVIDDLSGLIGTTVTGSQGNMSDLIGIVGQQSDGIIAMHAAAGMSPATTPATAGVHSPSPPSSATCASRYPSYPKHAAGRGAPSPASCYHDDSRIICKSHKRYRRHQHVYKNGHVVALAANDERVSGKC